MRGGILAEALSRPATKIKTYRSAFHSYNNNVHSRRSGSSPPTHSNLAVYLSFPTNTNFRFFITSNRIIESATLHTEVGTEVTLCVRSIWRQK